MSHITPIDSTSKATWADTLIRATQDVVDKGFGLCADGTEYDLNNFMCDTLAGNVPWNEVGLKELYTHLEAHPNFKASQAAFKLKYGQELFPLTYDLWLQAEWEMR